MRRSGRWRPIPSVRLREEPGPVRQLAVADVHLRIAALVEEPARVFIDERGFVRTPAPLSREATFARPGAARDRGHAADRTDAGGATF